MSCLNKIIPLFFFFSTSSGRTLPIQEMIESSGIRLLSSYFGKIEGCDLWHLSSMVKGKNGLDRLSCIIGFKKKTDSATFDIVPILHLPSKPGVIYTWSVTNKRLLIKNQKDDTRILELSFELLNSLKKAHTDLDFSYEKN